MATFSAAPQALGYLYQARVALSLLLQAPDEAVLRIEALDDIEMSGAVGAGSLSLVQLKHHTSASDLTDYSPDLWKSLRVWAEQATSQAFSLENAHIALMTTSDAPAGSVASMLAQKGRNIAGAEKALLAVAATSKSEALKPAFNAFTGLSSPQRMKLLSCLHIIPNQPDIAKFREDIRRKLRPSVRAQFVDALLDRVEGWWNDKVVLHLLANKGNASKGISAFDLYEKVAAIAEGFHAESLPIDYQHYAVDSHSISTSGAKQFVRQLQAIRVNSRTIDKAILDYFRAFHQRNRWLNDFLVNAQELTDYESLLKDEWERYFDLNCSNLDEATEKDLVEVGKKVLEWAEMKCDVRIRPKVNADFVRRGSFHFLADRQPVPPIHWHPKFIEGVAGIVVAAGHSK